MFVSWGVHAGVPVRVNCPPPKWRSCASSRSLVDQRGRSPPGVRDPGAGDLGIGRQEAMADYARERESTSPRTADPGLRTQPLLTAQTCFGYSSKYFEHSKLMF